MFNYKTYGELYFDNSSVWDLLDRYDTASFPLSLEDYEDAVAEQIYQEEAAHELAFHQYHSA
tara:strand:+ start:504 stop:689 length:186 start_codon:yes stop_codon:yes gene_type:complete